MSLIQADAKTAKARLGAEIDALHAESEREVGRLIALRKQLEEQIKIMDLQKKLETNSK